MIAQRLAYGQSNRDIAAAEHCSRRTVQRVHARYRPWIDHQQTRAAEAVAEALAGQVPHALQRLSELLDRDDTPTVQLGAARVILSEALRWRETVVIEERLNAIEERLSGAGQPWRPVIVPGMARHEHDAAQAAIDAAVADALESGA